MHAHMMADLPSQRSQPSKSCLNLCLNYDQPYYDSRAVTLQCVRMCVSLASNRCCLLATQRL